MRKHLFAVAAALLSFISGAAGISTQSAMRVEPIGYRVGTAGAIADFASSVVTVFPGGVSAVATNRQMTFTAALNGDYKIVCWQKFAVDPRVRENDPLEEFGTDSKTVTVDYDPNVDWMYVVVVVDYDLKVTADISSFGKGTVTVSPKKDSYAKGESVTLDVELDEGYRFVRWSDGNADHLRNLVLDTSVNLKACVEPKSSIVTFSPGDGATVGVTEKRVSYGRPYGALPVPTKTGSVFSGWADDEDRTVTAKTVVDRIDDHVLYAFWNSDLLEIAWDFTGSGNGKVDGAGIYAYGSQPTLKAVPYEGSEFTGWMDGVTLNPRRIVVVSNATYVARFDVATYDVTFTYRDASGNFVTIGPTIVEHGGKVDPPSKDVVDSWSEHTFTNWSTEEYKKVTRNLAVTAIYDTMTYSVAFAYRDWQGNCVTTMPQHVTAGGSANPPDRSVADNWAGHTLRGWQPDYNVIRQDTICEALYDDVRCMVKFSYRDKDGNLMAENVQVNYGEAVLETSVPPKSKVDQWPDHEFLGWDERYAEATNCVTDDLTVNARYKDVITVIYSPGKGQGDRQEFDLEEEGSYVILNPTNDLNYSRVGYAFDYWQSDDKKNYQPGDTVKLKAGDTLALTASWANNKYTIKFDGNGGECHKRSQTEEYDRPRSLSFVSGDFDHGVNYEFVGLGTNREEVLYAKPIKTPIFDWQPVVSNLTTEANATVTLYAIWQGMSQEVKINGVTTNIAYGSQLQQPPDPVRTGYTFSGGWKTNGIPVTFPITVTGGFDLIFEDKWTPIQYTVVFDGTDADGGTMDPQTFTYDAAQELMSNSFTRAGYTFANWTNKVGTAFADGALVKNLATNDGAVVDLYATWTMNPRYYAVRFNSNGGEGEPYVQNVLCGVTTELTPNRFARTGHAFTGWATNETDAAVYADNEPVTDLAAEGGTNDLYATWVPNRYWVKFDGSGADGEMVAQAFTYDVAQALTSNAFTRTGYGFAGWATNATGAAVYADGALVSNLTAEPDATNVLFAAWTVLSYEIRFDPAGGSAVSPVTNEYGKVTSAPAEPTRTGYQFAGWYRGDARYEFGQPMPAEDLALTAHWTANGYKVRFNPGEGTGEMDDQDFTYDEPRNLTANRFMPPEMKVFDCWTNTAGDAFADRVLVTNLTAEAGGVVTLWATWKDAPSYAVAFAGNGADGGSMATNRFECGKGGTLAKNAFTRTGYAFANWTNATATGMSPPLLSDGATFTVDLAPTNGTATLKALWAPNWYWVKFDGNGGVGSMAAQAFTYDAPQALTSNAFTRTGYGFAGWATNATATGMSPPLLADGAVVSNLTAEADATNALFAAWTVLSYEISFDSAGGSAVGAQTNEYDSPLTAPANPTRAGWTFSGWLWKGVKFDFGTATMPAEDITLVASWTENGRYTVRFDGNGGTNALGQATYEQLFTNDVAGVLRPNEFSRPGHDFAGNWTNAAGTAYADGATVTNLTKESSVDLFAVWTAHTHNVTWPEGTETGVAYGTLLEHADPTPPAGYQFAGWKMNGEPVELPVSMPDFDVTFVPTWATNRYWVAFDAKGGAGSMVAQAFTYDVAQALTSNAFTKTGHSFAGWATNAAGSAVYADGAVVSNLTAAADATNTLWAAWTANSYKVHYNPNGGSGSVVTQDFTYAQAQPLAQNPFEPPQPWMVFAGWSNATDKVVYNAGASVSNLTAEPDGQVDFYAIWADDSYTVTFDGNGGVGGMTPQVFAHGEKRSLAPNVFTRIGHSFKNWTNDDSSKSYMDQEEFTAPSTGDGETLRAVWTNNTYKYTLKYTSGDVSKSKKYGETITDPQPDSKTGYTFVGWTTNETDIVNFTGFTMPAHDVVFTSMLNPITYTVEFDANGGTGSADKINATYDQSFRLASSSGFSWSGYEFVSWTNANGQAWESDAIVSNLTTIANTNVTLYAKWQETGNQLSIALGLDPNFEVEVSAEGAWTVIGEAKDEFGLKRSHDSPSGSLILKVPSAGRLNFYFGIGDSSDGMTVKFNGKALITYGDDGYYSISPNSSGQLEFSGTPDDDFWTLREFKWTPSSAN